jgi:hypothetical protein
MYSRKKLQSILAAPGLTDETQQVVQRLANSMYKGDKLSLAEQDFLGIVFGSLVDENGQREDMHKYEGLKDDLFRHLYPRYVRNRDGLLDVSDAYGAVPPERRKKDAAFLESEYQSWRSIILNENPGSATLQHLVNETKKHLADIDEFAKQARYGSRLKDATVKEIILHSKYLYYLVQEYYQELGAEEEMVTFTGGKIVVDSYSYVHTLFRHYSQHIKSYQLGKSYHFDTNFDHIELPSHLIKVIESYFRNLPNAILGDRIYFRVRGALYALWFRKLTRSLKGGVKEEYFRLQTFYPVIDHKDLSRIAALKEILSDDGIGLFYQP